MSRRGFQVETVFCETCGETADGLPDSFSAEGLPEGWMSVRVARYQHRRGEEDRPTTDTHQWTYYFCSDAHIPAELLPEEAQYGE